MAVDFQKALTQQFEGWVPNIYTDTKGNPTIGYGFNLNDPLVKKLIPADIRQGKRKMTKSEAQVIFDVLYGRAFQDAQNTIGKQYFNQLPKEAQTVFTDMSYNLGKTKFSGFQNMIQAAQKQNWKGVSREMQDSNWYNQVGNRSKKLQKMINTLLPKK